MARRVAAAFCALVIATSASTHAVADDHWVATWTASTMPADASPDGINQGFDHQTVRSGAHVSIGGRSIRVRLSNIHGERPLVIGAAAIARASPGESQLPAAGLALRFAGRKSVVIPAGADALSDPVDLRVAPLSDLAVSLYFPERTGPLSWHQLGMQTSFQSQPGDWTLQRTLPVEATTTSFYVLSAIEVSAAPRTGAVAVLGDSITDGYASTRDANHRWTDFLAARLSARGGTHGLAVLNAGISGNRLLHDTVGPAGVGRFERDVLAQPGLTHVVLYEGINDIGLPGWLGRPAEGVSGDQIIAALAGLAQRAHGRHLKVYGATLAPFEDAGEPYYSADGELRRQQVNAWIRCRAAFDAVIDFDRVLRDPDHPTRMNPAYDSGDHLHPNDAGYAAMAATAALLLAEPDRDPRLLRSASGQVGGHEKLAVCADGAGL